mmetsp:Transcript_9628/g.14437  ORF Transcript_9628/g.14437 Transcript_9628/m.14437 type:complete len:208 (+) Transcript_9628:1308-1931(+)
MVVMMMVVVARKKALKSKCSRLRGLGPTSFLVTLGMHLSQILHLEWLTTQQMISLILSLHFRMVQQLLGETTLLQIQVLQRLHQYQLQQLRPPLLYRKLFLVNSKPLHRLRVHPLLLYRNLFLLRQTNLLDLLPKQQSSLPDLPRLLFSLLCLPRQLKRHCSLLDLPRLLLLYQFQLLCRILPSLWNQFYLLPIHPSLLACHRFKQT